MPTLPVSIVIPTLNPSEKILSVVNELKAAEFERIIVVNDGSDPDKASIFEKLQIKYSCVVLTHDVNRGKGRALKTAMEYFLDNPNGEAGIITLDDDGQHTVADTVRVGEALIQNPSNLILGVRDFNSPDVPPKSKWGNKITALFMKIACGVSVSDTQTGLRAIPESAMKYFIKTPGERFEYESNMLLDASSLGINITEVVIQTVYIEKNKSSHFNPLLDSVRIYKQLFKFAASSLISFAIDYILFWVLTLTLPLNGKTLVFASAYTARLFSSVVNFLSNKKLVFGKSGGTARSLVRYYALCIVQTTLSAVIVSVLSNIAAGNMLTLWKLIADVFLFFISYRIQQLWVFSRKI